MGLSVIFLALLLLQSALSLNEDSFEDFDIFGADVEPYADRQSRSNDKFLRFGKAFWDYESGNEGPYSDKDVQRPSRTGRQEQNEHLTGSPQQRTARDKSSFLRFGRSISEQKKRDKREATASAEALKRHENYLRFGRTANSNFMRFGRNLGSQSALFEEEMMRPSLETRNKHLLDYLKSLLRQPDNSPRHVI